MIFRSFAVFSLGNSSVGATEKELKTGGMLHHPFSHTKVSLCFELSLFYALQSCPSLYLASSLRGAMTSTSTRWTFLVCVDYIVYLFSAFICFPPFILSTPANLL